MVVRGSLRGSHRGQVTDGSSREDALLALFAATARGRETMKRAGGLSALMDDSPLVSRFSFPPYYLTSKYELVVGVWVVQQVYVHHVYYVCMYE